MNDTEEVSLKLQCFRDARRINPQKTVQEIVLDAEMIWQWAQHDMKGFMEFVKTKMKVQEVE